MENEVRIADLVFWKDWHNTDTGKNLFPGVESLRWFIRSNMSDLLEQDAIVIHRSRWYLVGHRFELAVIRSLRESTRRVLGSNRVHEVAA